MNESEKMEHGKEPWTAETCKVVADSYSIYDADGKFACPYKKANAARIVACVNFCAGVPTDTLPDLKPLRILADLVGGNWLAIQEQKAENESLRAELAKNQAAREWISVEDSLPPDKHNVLVRHDGGHEFGHITSIAHRFYGGWFPPYREDVIIKVSHWRELPEPPPELRALIQPEEKK